MSHYFPNSFHHHMVYSKTNGPILPPCMVNLPKTSGSKFPFSIATMPTYQRPVGQSSHFLKTSGSKIPFSIATYQRPPTKDQWVKDPLPKTSGSKIPFSIATYQRPMGSKFQFSIATMVNLSCKNRSAIYAAKYGPPWTKFVDKNGPPLTIKGGPFYAAKNGPPCTPPRQG